MNIKDKKVIVTGGAKGIGKVLADELLEKGATVGIFDFDEKELNKLENPKLYCKVCDVTDTDQVKKCVDDVRYQNRDNDRFG